MNVSIRLLLAGILTALALALPGSSIADARDEAVEYCSRYTYETGVKCDSQRCPCGRTTTELERWDRGGLKFSYCACASKSDLAAASEPPPPECRTDRDCNDGVWCNGVEQCNAGACAPGRPPCGSNQCWEESDQCEAACEDRDGDGYEAIHCGGDDCDDQNPSRSPGNPEICDAQGIDEDCNARTVGDRDEDRDGFISPDCR